jgi:putative DNA primase/helicase
MKAFAENSSAEVLMEGFSLAGPSKPFMSDEELDAAIKALPLRDTIAVERLLPHLLELSELRRVAVLRQIADQTGLDKASLSKALAALARQSRKPDDLSLAEKVLDHIGHENLLCSDEGTYGWCETGVWKYLGKQALQSMVQNALALAGQPVLTKKVQDVATTLFNLLYRPGNRFGSKGLDLINCINGELVLQDGEWHLRPHARDSYLTSQIPVSFDPLAEAPRFMAFLDEVFGCDFDCEAKIRALLECLGYSLVPHCRYERFGILLGDGANGKSVILSLLGELLGHENISAVPMSQFDRTFARAQLQDKLANIVTELAFGEVLADAAVKAIVSGEPTTVEHKFQAPFVLRPYATLWLSTNHMPHTRDYSPAIMRRALIVRFNRSFSPEEQDRTLLDKLKEELPGILNLVLKAYASATVNGFTNPPSSEAAKAEWRKDADQVAEFVDECCEVDTSVETPVQQLYTAYQGWAISYGHSRPVTLKTFSQRLQTMGYKRGRNSTSRTIVGLKLTATDVGF